MGLLRKLAGLVVEFPDEQQPKPGDSQTGDDVVAAIEQIRKNLEQTEQAQFNDETEHPAPAAKPGADVLATPGPPPATPSAESGLASLAAQQIPLPRVLSIKEIYDKAKLPVGQDFDIFKVEEMLADPEIADLDIAMRARMVRMTLKNMNRELEDILADATLRDRALESYLEFLDGRVGETTKQLDDVNAAIKRELEEIARKYEGVIEQNRLKRRQLADALADFKRTKEAEEQRLFNIAAPFVGPGANPVDIGEQPEPDKAG
jgi:hypothetical protein